VVEQQLVDPSCGARRGAALQLVRPRPAGGRRAAGLILADTKYEFGVDQHGELLLIDEVHTPDSSRYWVADTYEERLAAGDEPESLDKELVRRALLATGYRGDGPPARPCPTTCGSRPATRYIDAYERLTGTTFQPGAYPVGPRILEHLSHVH
jgi:phosphoribosylaminoimidazole-succinocarboxamide synthase